MQALKPIVTILFFSLSSLFTPQLKAIEECKWYHSFFCLSPIIISCLALYAHVQQAEDYCKSHSEFPLLQHEVRSGHLEEAYCYNCLQDFNLSQLELACHNQTQDSQKARKRDRRIQLYVNSAALSSALFFFSVAISLGIESYFLPLLAQQANS